VERSSSPLRRRALAGAQSRLICRRRSMSSAACRTRRQHADPCSNQVSAVTSRAGGGRTNGFEPIVQTFDCVSRFAVPHPGKCSAGRSCPEQAWRASSSTRSVVRSTDSSRVLRHSPKYASRGKPRTRPQRKQIIHGHSNVRWPLVDVFRSRGRVSRSSSDRSDESNPDRGSTILSAPVRRDHTVHSHGHWSAPRESPGEYFPHYPAQNLKL
jgi:hypothetical protein